MLFLIASLAMLSTGLPAQALSALGGAPIILGGLDG